MHACMEWIQFRIVGVRPTLHSVLVSFCEYDMASSFLAYLGTGDWQSVQLRQVHEIIWVSVFYPDLGNWHSRKAIRVTVFGGILVLNFIVVAGKEYGVANHARSCHWQGEISK